MTKILAVSSPALSCHGCDRLVSSGGAHFDRLANKTLVYVARDAIAFMSYTGSAYLEQIPTDEWVARTLTGVDDVVPPPPGYYSGGATWTSERHGPLPQWLDIGQAAQLLACELEDVRHHLEPDEQPPAILISGVQWKRRRPWVWQPFLGVVEAPPSIGAYRSFFPSASRPGEPFLMCEMPMPFTLDEKERADVSAAIQRHGPDPDRIEREVASALRLAASKAPGTIGDEAVTASVAARAADVIRLRFHSPRSRMTSVRRHSDGEFESIEVAYTPWLIAPDVVIPPKALMGITEIGLGTVRVGTNGWQPLRAVIVDAPAPRGTGRLVGAASGAPRRRNPRRQRRRRK